MNYSKSAQLERVLNLLDGVHKIAKGWQACCPAHDDNKASLSVSAGDGGNVLLHCHAGCATVAVVQKLGLTMRDLAGDDGAHKLNGRGAAGASRAKPSRDGAKPSHLRPEKTGRGNIVEAYDYRDERGELLFQAVRLYPKTFRQRRPDGKGGWIWKLDGVPLVLYRLSELLQSDSAQPVYICEGEKDADRLAEMGCIATTNPMGAGKWRATFNAWLRGRDVVILPDNDKAGRNHAEEVAQALHGVAASVRVVELPRLTDKGDVSDWLNAGGTLEALDGLAQTTPQWARKVNGATADAVGGELSAVVVNLADVEPQPIRWLWPNRIAVGKLTVIACDPGLGKSFLTLDLAARVTNGCIWPDDTSTHAPQGSVVLLTAEDDLADTVRPRLDAAGANVRKVVAIPSVRWKMGNNKSDRLFDLSRDIAQLEAAVRELDDCKLVIIDPISAYLGKTNANDNAEVRGVLAPVSEMAGRLGVAVLAVSHLRKGEGPAIYRTMGSVAFIAAARAAFVVLPDKDDTTGNRRLFLPLKNNIGNDRTGLAFELSGRHGSEGQPCVLWSPEAITTKADDAFAPRGRGRKPEEREDATEFLKRALAKGSRPVKEINDEARNGYQISKRTLTRAREKLGVITFRESPKGPWHLKLPDGQKAKDGDPESAIAELWHSGALVEGAEQSGGFAVDEDHNARMPDCQSGTRAGEAFDGEQVEAGES